jgi:hypothetical protein
VMPIAAAMPVERRRARIVASDLAAAEAEGEGEGGGATWVAAAAASTPLARGVDTPPASPLRATLPARLREPFALLAAASSSAFFAPPPPPPRECPTPSPWLWPCAPPSSPSTCCSGRRVETNAKKAMPQSM